MTRTRPSRSPRALAAACGAALLLASGCGRGGSAPQAAKAEAPRHALSSGENCAGVDVHTKHLNMFACVHCHPAGATFGFDVPYVFAGGTTTLGGTIVRIAGVPPSCTVACHFPKGAPARSVAWSTPGPLACADCHAPSALPAGHPPVPADPTRADCEGCHVTTAHMEGTVALVGHAPAFKTDQTSAEFHAVSANEGLASCQGCHGQDLAGGGARASCARCHDVGLPVGVASWKVNCVMCHGGTDGQTGAPPVATWGNQADAVRVGAHTAHVRASAISPGFDCAVCHVKPADALAGGHVDAGPAELRFAGTATAGLPTPAPVWDRTAATCTATYCHGATMAGGTKPTPVWTRTGEAACGACHGLPPPAPHATAAGLTSCASCHAATIGADGVIIAPSAGGKHLDGAVQATGGHPAGWMDPANAGFHAVTANQNLAGCGSCHGPNLDGVGGTATTSCATAGCHGPSWRTNCVMCHGGVDNQTGAPPQGTWGHEAEARRVGGHTKHLGTTLTAAVACAECHPVPADALAAGHVDGGAVKLTFGARARAGGAAPSFEDATGRCASTYCHGNYSGTYVYSVWDWGCDGGEGCAVPRYAPYVGAGATPAWSDAPMTCASCHGDPPAQNGWWHSGSHGSTASQRECQTCHPDATTVAGGGNVITNPARHIDGIVDVTPNWTSPCYGCH